MAGRSLRLPQDIILSLKKIFHLLVWFGGSGANVGNEVAAPMTHAIKRQLSKPCYYFPHPPHSPLGSLQDAASTRFCKAQFCESEKAFFHSPQMGNEVILSSR